MLSKTYPLDINWFINFFFWYCFFICVVPNFLKQDFEPNGPTGSSEVTQFVGKSGFMCFDNQSYL